MNRRIALLAALALATAAPAQEPAPPPATPPDPTWQTDLIVGVPTAVRWQRLVDPAAEPGRRGLWVEGMVGLYTIFPMVGGGVRWHAPTAGDGADAFLVSPGLDVFLLPNVFDGSWLDVGPAVFGLATADVDYAWHHRYRNGACGELGVKLGLGCVVADRVGVVPVVSLFGGVRY